MAPHASRGIWHAGNWCIHLGQPHVESPFKSEKKDIQLLNNAQPFADALCGLNIMPWKHHPQFWKQVVAG